MNKSHDQPLKTLLAFISLMNRKFISKIERGDSFFTEPIKPVFWKIPKLVVLLLRARKSKKNYDTRLVLPL